MHTVPNMVPIVVYPGILLKSLAVSAMLAYEYQKIAHRSVFSFSNICSGLSYGVFNATRMGATPMNTMLPEVLLLDPRSMSIPS